MHINLHQDLPGHYYQSFFTLKDSLHHLLETKTSAHTLKTDRIASKKSIENIKPDETLPHSYLLHFMAHFSNRHTVIRCTFKNYYQWQLQQHRYWAQKRIFAMSAAIHSKYISRAYSSYFLLPFPSAHSTAPFFRKILFHIPFWFYVLYFNASTAQHVMEWFLFPSQFLVCLLTVAFLITEERLCPGQLVIVSINTHRS